MIIIPGNKKNLARRYWANIIDYFIVWVCIAIYTYLVGDVDESGARRVVGFKAMALPVLWFLYFPFCESTMGQTLGKKVFHLHVVDLTGKTPTIVHAFLRRMLDMFEIVFFGIPVLLVINNSAMNQRVGDMMAGTTVVRTDAVCRHCGVELELTPQEVVYGTFRCPSCSQSN